MGKIVCLMGRSSSGKDTIYKKLLQQDEVIVENIVPYTTRPIRAGEKDGVEYHFTDEEGFQKLLGAGSVIEARAYHTRLGLWRYFTVADERVDLERCSYMMITTLEAYEQIQKFYGADRVLFGTDYPMWTAAGELKRFSEIPLTEREREMILHENAENLLKL